MEANWDVDQLLEQKERILKENLLTTTVRGYPFESAEDWERVVKGSLARGEQEQNGAGVCGGNNNNTEGIDSVHLSR